MVHGNQPLKNWTGGAKPSAGKRKAMDISSPSNENNDHAKQKRTKTSSSQFLVDGFPPINPHPQNIAHRQDIAFLSKLARRKSVDTKSPVLQLIDETYPPLICPECYHLSTARTEADQHLKSKHLGQKVFKCVSSSCTQVYSSKAGMRYHIEHAHQISRINDESQSPSSSNKKANRQQQISTIAHSPSTSSSSISTQNDTKKSKKPQLASLLEKKLNKVYPLTACPACNKEFKKKTHVIKHLVEVHHGEEPYKCIVSTCKRTKKYATREGLVYHLNAYHANGPNR